GRATSGSSCCRPRSATDGTSSPRGWTARRALSRRPCSDSCRRTRTADRRPILPGMEGPQDGDRPVPVLTGERVVLRPFRMDELAAWIGARTAAAGDRTVAPGGAPDAGQMRERTERSGLMRERRLDLAIESNGRLVGEIGTFADPEEGSR